ncbi:hypothetical protein GCM10027594_29680 [Hymenobacter agri]
MWQADFGQRENNNPKPTILDGFYGAEHRHIAVILDEVVSDSLMPNVLRVRGRTRFNKHITPFAGSITVQTIKSVRAFLDLDSVETTQARAYSATGRFVLREDSTAPGAGTYQGTALMDFYRQADGALHLVESSRELPTRGSGLLFRGQWKSFRTGRLKPVAFATYADAVLPNTMTDLYIGERGQTINPKYARLDWSEAWENDEWWARPAKPALSL